MITTTIGLILCSLGVGVGLTAICYETQVLGGK